MSVHETGSDEMDGGNNFCVFCGKPIPRMNKGSGLRKFCDNGCRIAWTRLNGGNKCLATPCSPVWCREQQGKIINKALDGCNKAKDALRQIGVIYIKMGKREVRLRGA